jgi:hypothetical protein
MLDELRQFQASVAELSKSVRAAGTVQITSRPTRERAKAVVDFFFRFIRPVLVQAQAPSELLNSCDMSLQSLLQASHGRASSNTYKSILKSIEKCLVDLEKYALVVGNSTHRFSINTTDLKIVSTLRDMVPSAAHSYEQAMTDLETSNRISWRGPATDLREALREVLDHLAPDGEVMGQTGYQQDPNTNGPTMKQKVRYILHRRGVTSAAIQSQEATVGTVEEMMSTFVRSVYTRSNVSTHTPTDKAEVLRVRELIRIALCEILSISTQ